MLRKLPKLPKGIEQDLDRILNVKGVSGDPNSNPKYTLSQVKEALNFLDPDMPYDHWVMIGMAIAKSGMPFSLWHEWSRWGNKYQGSHDLIKHWNCFIGDNCKSLRTILLLAEKYGWEPKGKKSKNRKK